MESSSKDVDSILDARRRQAVVDGILANRWSWVGVVISAALAVWVSQFSGQMAGTAGFYVGLFVVFAVLALAKGVYGVHRRLKQVKFAAD
jgi:hypothetical protein